MLKEKTIPTLNISCRTWFTENTEIRTLDDWLEPSHLTQIEYVLGYKDNLFCVSSVKEFNRMYYTGYIRKAKDKEYGYEGFFLLPDKEIKRIDYSLVPQDEEEIYYEGWLYNVVTDSNTLITRTITNDYIISLCKIAE